MSSEYASLGVLGRKRIFDLLHYAAATLSGCTHLASWDRRHFNAPFLLARVAAWFWLAIYAIVPPAMVAVWFRQLRATGEGRARSAALSKSFLVVLTVQAVPMLIVGLGLFMFPATLIR